MSKSRRGFWAWIFLTGWALVYGQEAQIIFADGEGFTLVREGESVFHDLFEEPAEGMVLLPGDLILTEQETWIEIEIGTTGSIVRIAENTTFSIDSLENQGGVFGVSYGRVRAKVEKLLDDSPFWVRGVDTVAGVRGTDFGYDLFYDKEVPGSTRTEVYCFQGKVEVVKVPAEVLAEKGGISLSEEDRENTVVLGRNEMVTVASDSPEELEKVRVSSEVKEFWEENDFQYDTLPELTADGTPRTSAAFQRSLRKDADAARLRSAALYSSATGLLIGGAGAAALLMEGDKDVAVGLGSVGGFLVVSGGYFFLRALMIEGPSSAGAR